MITLCAAKITDMLVNRSGLTIDQDQRDVYIYGLECLLNTGITGFLLFIWSIATDTFLETLVWLLSFILFRKYAGGFHAPTQFACILSSFLLGCSNLIVLKKIEPTDALFLCAYLFCAVICFLFAPIETAKKPLTSKVRGRYKLISLVILFVGFLATYIMPLRIGTSITYAFVCAAFLVLIKQFSITKIR